MSAKKIDSNYSWQSIFHEYFIKSINEKPLTTSNPGPFISISREFGCIANNIAQKLSIELSKSIENKGKKKEWKWINKEILIESAKALNLKPEKIEYVFLSRQKSAMDEFVSAMTTKYFKSDKAIRKTITNVIRSILSDGNVIIVGRGGVSFGNKIPRSIHIKLIAPLDWRVQRISKNYKMETAEAEKHIRKVDTERKQLVDSFFQKETDNSIFDLIFNRKTVSEDHIIKTIIELSKIKKII